MKRRTINIMTKPSIRFIGKKLGHKEYVNVVNENNIKH